MYQDNQSAILLEKNGRASSSKKTKHLNIRYFFITDRIKKGELHIEYCPTDNMVADCFYQTSSSQEISPVQKSNYEPTGLKSTLNKGVCWESTYFILHKFSNVWIPVTLTYCLISYTQRDYLNFNIGYFGVTI